MYLLIALTTLPVVETAYTIIRRFHLTFPKMRSSLSSSPTWRFGIFPTLIPRTRRHSTTRSNSISCWLKIHLMYRGWSLRTEDRLRPLYLPTVNTQSDTTEAESIYELTYFGLTFIISLMRHPLYSPQVNW